MEERIKKLEARVDKLEDRQHNLEKEQAETRVYIKQIFDKVDDLKKDLTTMFNNYVTTQHSQDDSQKDWIDFAKWIIGGTIVLIATYIFKGGN